MEPLTDLTPETFRDHVGARFGVAGADFDLLLASLDDTMAGAGARAGGAFSLYFHGPREPMLPQATYQLAHEALGDLLLFLVPVRQTADGVEYEAAFN